MLFFVIPSFFDNMLENSFDLCLLGDWGVMSMCFFSLKITPIQTPFSEEVPNQVISELIPT